MLSLLFLIGGIAGLSAILPSVDESSDGDDEATTSDTSPQIDQPTSSTTSDTDGNESGAVTSASEVDFPTIDDTADDYVAHDVTDDPDDTSGGDATDPIIDDTPPPDLGVDYSSATQITLTYPDGEEVDFNLEDYKETDISGPESGIKIYRMPLEDGSELEFALDWGPDDDGDTVYNHQVDVTLGDAQTDWDFRDDAFTVELKDADGTVLNDTPEDIDTLELNNLSNNIVTSNTIQIRSFDDDAEDNVLIMMDEVEDGESFDERGHYGVGTNPPPIGSIMPINIFQPNDDGSPADEDSVQVEIDPGIEGHVHLLNVSSSTVSLSSFTGSPPTSSSWTTVQYLLRTDSAEAPDLSDLNLHRTGAVSPEDGIDVLGAFNLGVTEISAHGGEVRSNVEPEYTGKALSTETSTTRTFFV